MPWLPEVNEGSEAPEGRERCDEVLEGREADEGREGCDEVLEGRKGCDEVLEGRGGDEGREVLEGDEGREVLADRGGDEGREVLEGREVRAKCSKAMKAAECSKVANAMTASKVAKAMNAAKCWQDAENMKPRMLWKCGVLGRHVWSRGVLEGRESVEKDYPSRNPMNGSPLHVLFRNRGHVNIRRIWLETEL